MTNEELGRSDHGTQLLCNAEILQIATQYIDLEEQTTTKSEEWLSIVDPRHLSGSPNSVYLKKLGHRLLTKEDRINLVLLYGTAEQKQLLKSFEQVQIDLSKRLKSISNVGLVLKQAGINYNTYYTRRSKEPKGWKAQEIIDIVNVLERIRL